MFFQIPGSYPKHNCTDNNQTLASGSPVKSCLLYLQMEKLSEFIQNDCGMINSNTCALMLVVTPAFIAGMAKFYSQCLAKQLLLTHCLLHHNQASFNCSAMSIADTITIFLQKCS